MPTCRSTTETRCCQTVIQPGWYVGISENENKMQYEIELGTLRIQAVAKAPPHQMHPCPRKQGARGILQATKRDFARIVVEFQN